MSFFFLKLLSRQLLEHTYKTLTFIYSVCLNFINFFFCYFHHFKNPLLIGVAPRLKIYNRLGSTLFLFSCSGTEEAWCMWLHFEEMLKTDFNLEWDQILYKLETQIRATCKRCILNWKGIFLVTILVQEIKLKCALLPFGNDITKKKKNQKEWIYF